MSGLYPLSRLQCSSHRADRHRRVLGRILRGDDAKRPRRLHAYRSGHGFVCYPLIQPDISFERSRVTVTVPIDSAVYQGARITDREVTVYGNVSESEWVADSYRAMIDDPAQDTLYRNLTDAFRKIRDENNLSDDEYLELMATYVQSFPYVNIPGNLVKFPIETVMEKSGTCEDRSLLLAGLLSHEGYRVALFSFGPESHGSRYRVEHLSLQKYRVCLPRDHELLVCRCPNQKT